MTAPDDLGGLLADYEGAVIDLADLVEQEAGLFTDLHHCRVQVGAARHAVDDARTAYLHARQGP